MATIIWLAIYLGVLIWSGIQPHDYPTWLLEVLPAVIVLIVLGLTRRHFPLTPMLYGLILIHAVILMVGGHYTYARVPYSTGCSRCLIGSATTTTSSDTSPRVSYRP